MLARNTSATPWPNCGLRVKQCYWGGDDLIAAAIRLCTTIPGLPQRALAREALIAQVEISRLLRATIRDLERRAKRGKR